MVICGQTMGSNMSVVSKRVVAAKLKELSARLQVMETGPKVRHKRAAYTNAANAILKFPGKLTSGEQLRPIRGIGDSIIKKVDEILATGSLKKLDDFDHFASDYSGLMKIQGVGPVKAQQLFKEHNITSVEELRDLLVDGRIDDPKMLRNVEWALEVKGERIPHRRAKQLAQAIMEPLKAAVPRARVEICGSIRRKKATSKDIDIVFAAATQAQLRKGRKAFMELGWDDVLGEGDTRITVVKDGVQVDIRFVPLESYGSAVLHFTGSGEFNVVMRARAKAKGYLLNEYGLFRRGANGTQGKLVASKTEQEIFGALGYPFIEPKEREAEVWTKISRGKMRTNK